MAMLNLSLKLPTSQAAKIRLMRSMSSWKFGAKNGMLPVSSPQILGDCTLWLFNIAMV
jgi:hypothetical protein